MNYEVVKCPDAEADETVKAVGYVVVSLDQARGLTLEQAARMAAENMRTRGGRWGVFRLCAVTAAGAAPVAPPNPMIEKSRQALAGVK